MEEKKIYKFQYLSLKKLLILLVSAIGIMVILLSSINFIVKLTRIEVGLIIVIVASLLPFASIYFLRKKFIVYGKGAIESNNLILELDNRTWKIELGEIRNYSFNLIRESRLKLRLKSGEKISFHADERFCDPSGLADFLKYFNKEIKNYQRLNPHSDITQTGTLEEVFSNWIAKNSTLLQIVGYTCAIAGVLFLFFNYSSGVFFTHLGFGVLAFHSFFVFLPYLKQSTDHKTEISKIQVVENISVTLMYIGSAVLFIGIDFYFTSIAGYVFLLGVGLLTLLLATPSYIILLLVSKKSNGWMRLILPALLTLVCFIILLGYVNL